MLVEFDISSFRYRGPTREACYALFSEMGFRSLVMDYAPTADTTAKDYRARLHGRRSPGARRRASARPADSACACSPTALRPSAPASSAWRSPPRRGRHGMCRSAPTDRHGALTRSNRAQPVGFGGPTTGPVRCPGSLGFRRRRRGGPGPTCRFARSQDNPSPACRLAGRALDAVSRPVLEDPAIEKVGHDLKFDAIVLARHGVELDGLGIDTMLASYLLDATRSGHPLEAIALEHLGYKALDRGGPLRPRRQGGRARRARTVRAC